MNIKSPYTQTPYDLLSDANNPRVGVITPDSTRTDIRKQHGKVVVARVRAPLDVTAALNTLLNAAGRMKCDVFLTTTLNITGDAGDVFKSYPCPAAPDHRPPDWLAELGWVRPAADFAVAESEVKLAAQSNYNLPEVRPPALKFEP